MTTAPDEAAAAETLRVRLALARARQREATAAAAARRVLYVATTWGIDARVRRDAEYAAARAAALLGLGFTPRIKWFRRGTAGDRPWDEGVFLDVPGLGGFVDPADEHTIWVSTDYCRPGAELRPGLQETVAHEVQHLADLGDGRHKYSRGLRERRAAATAQALVRGEAAPWPR